MNERLLVLLERHGRATTSFQALEPGLCYWFDGPDNGGDGGDSAACVAYADTGAAWVAVGGPIGPPDRHDATIERFVAAAREAGRRVRFFAVEHDECHGHEDLDYIHIGEQPSWNPASWPEVLRGKRSLREQLRRARAKGVTARRVDQAELRDPASGARRGIDGLVARWKDSRSMAPMGFVVQIDLYRAIDARRFHVAERDGEVVALLAAIPVYARRGWFFEDVLRHPEAPNGTIELLFDCAMRDAAADGGEHVTFGLAPLAGSPSRLLCFIRDHTRWLYDFEGLRAFKAKLGPDCWEPVYLAFPGDTGRSGRVRRAGATALAVLDTLVAFAHGSLVKFGLATLRHRATAVTRILALLLLPWTLAMALSDTATWFPSPAIKMAWLGLDLVLFVALMILASRWRRGLAMILSGAALVDVTLGTVQAALYNGPRARGVVDWLVIAAALAAPLFATIFLWSCRGRATLYHRVEESPDSGDVLVPVDR